MSYETVEKLIQKNDSKIVMIVMDGVGGIPNPIKTELQAACKPNLDALAKDSECGLLTPVFPGITPGSGPGHFALFGYEPIKYNIGRGVLAACGINFPLKSGDLAARINFCTVDENGNVIDRRAGRIPNEECERICKKLSEKIKSPEGYEIFIRPVKEHRALLVIRGKDLAEDIQETDPQKTGVPPLEPEPLSEKAKKTSEIVKNIIKQVKDILKDESKANMILLRGFAEYHKYPSMEERFGLKCLALASYPMYKGIARLLGMDVLEGLSSIKEEFDALKENYDKYDFFFVHIKYTDSRGEDGNFDAKVKAIEETDKYIPIVRELDPDVIVVTADHSTPSKMKSHSWHPVPVILYSKYARKDFVESFDEYSCAKGIIGQMPTYQFFSYILANAGRLKKFGA